MYTTSVNVLRQDSRSVHHRSVLWTVPDSEFEVWRNARRHRPAAIASIWAPSPIPITGVSSFKKSTGQFDFLGKRRQVAFARRCPRDHHRAGSMRLLADPAAGSLPPPANGRKYWKRMRRPSKMVFHQAQIFTRSVLNDAATFIGVSVPVCHRKSIRAALRHFGATLMSRVQRSQSTIFEVIVRLTLSMSISLSWKNCRSPIDIIQKWRPANAAFQVEYDAWRRHEKIAADQRALQPIRFWSDLQEFHERIDRATRACMLTLQALASGSSPGSSISADEFIEYRFPHQNNDARKPSSFSVISPGSAADARVRR